MTNIQTYLHEDSNKDLYPNLLQMIVASFDKYSSSPLFVTNVSEEGSLYDTFLNELPEHARQHYACRSCAKFVNNFGGLVTILEDGSIVPVMWDAKLTPAFFKDSVKAVIKKVKSSVVNGVFITSEQVLGIPTTGGFYHMASTLDSQSPSLSKNRYRTDYQIMAEKKQDFQTLINALLEFDLDTAEKAVTLLGSDTIYRADRVLPIAKFFNKLHQDRASIKGSKQKTNLVWLAVATAPEGFTHIKSSMIGTLLEDISSGMTTERVKGRFEEKMNPANYMRSQSAPTQGNVQQAEKIVEQMGIADSLQRRYATYDEIQELIWKNHENPTLKRLLAEQSRGGVFGNITPKGKTASNANDAMVLPQKTMTFAKFQRTVLPTADSLEVLIDNPSRFMALVTASNEDAPNILKWDNTFSWYYHGGADGEIKNRVEQAGGRYENNEIRCSLIWEGYTDLDLHCNTPRGSHIYYGEKRQDNGHLDVDANGIDGKTLTPVENIRWSLGSAPEGEYQYYVHNYSQDRMISSETFFKVELEVNGKVFTHSGVLGNNEKEVVFNFRYNKGQDVSLSSTFGESQSSNNSWNVPVNSFVKVNGIVNSPNNWGKKVPTGNHTFFLLEGVKDMSEGKGRGFFNEMLKSDLREIRKTLEAYTANSSIEGLEDATACGVGFTEDNDWNLIVKVKVGTSTQLIKIDRFE